MNKYIDAEKLIAEIKRKKEYALEHYHNQGDIQSAYNICCEILSSIESLQQEPRFPQYDNIVEKVFGAGNLEGFEYHEAEMLVALAKEELLKSLQREQTEAEKEIELPKDIKGDAVLYCFDHGINITPRQATDFAIHYLMLGHNDGYVKGRKDAHISAKQLGLPSSLDKKPEVDFEKAIDDYYHENLGFIIGPNDTKKIVEDIALHFYELGLNARKE